MADRYKPRGDMYENTSYSKLKLEIEKLKTDLKREVENTNKVLGERDAAHAAGEFSGLTRASDFAKHNAYRNGEWIWKQLFSIAAKEAKERKTRCVEVHCP